MTSCSVSQKAVAKSWYRIWSGSHVVSETSRRRQTMAVELSSEDSTLSGEYTLRISS